MTNLCALLPVVGLLLLAYLSTADKTESSTKSVSSKDANDLRGLTPFFLQDPYDQMCLGPHGFTNCDERALWLLTRRNGKKTYSLVSFLNPNQEGSCMQRKPTFFGLLSSSSLSLGSCKRGNAKAWEWEFLDKQLVRLTNNGQCIARGKKGHKSSISLEPCKSNEVLPLLYHPTSVHENGFYLKSADGSCFDGAKFRSCTGSGSGSLLWGVGIKYVWGEANQYLFSFSKKEKTCLNRKGRKVSKDTCDAAGTLGWGMVDGALSSQKGQLCIARRESDEAFLLPCKQGSEYITMEIPSVYTTEELASMLQDPVSFRVSSNCLRYLCTYISFFVYVFLRCVFRTFLRRRRTKSRLPSSRAEKCRRQQAILL